jgi:glucokinase
MNSPSALIGLDVGGTGLKALAFAPDGKRLAEAATATCDNGTSAWLERARDLVNQVREQCPPSVAVSVAAPGLPAPDGRSIAHMPGRLSGLESLDWQQWLGMDAPVKVFNDAHAALLGEVWIGAARGASNVVLLTLGTGVGGAVMVDGRVLRGRLGRAGHLGHVSLNPDGPLDIVNTPGSLEDAIGEHTVAARTQGRFPSTRELVAAAHAGTPEAVRYWRDSVHALGAALAGFINVLDPELIILGGGIADADDDLFKPLAAELDRFEWRPGGSRVRVVKAQLGHHAGATGAAYGAKLEATNVTAQFLRTT